MTRPLVYLVDDDASVREGLTLLLESAGLAVSAHARAEDMLAAYLPCVPACLVLDLALPGHSGLELQEMLLARGFHPPIIFLTGHGDVPAAVKALKLGAMDFLQKPVIDPQTLLDRVETAIARHRLQLERDATRNRAQGLLAMLTPRERQVMDSIVAGKANKVMAMELGISERTVEQHRARVMHKLEVHSVPDLVRLVQEASN